ncbi:MAG: CHRD domain-containing protein [Burkholderiaceae bacterium]|nr:CHRD domain-containing protein [Burkholderiaceae bacterium]
MTKTSHLPRLASSIAALVITLATGTAFAADLVLSGANEVPPVTTSASGTGSITIAADGTVSGSVKTMGVKGTMAHIHRGAAGKNGPVLIPLTAGAEGEWMVPAGAKLDAEGMKAYQAGELYVNVHSEANKGGELRVQLKP